MRKTMKTAAVVSGMAAVFALGGCATPTKPVDVGAVVVVPPVQRPPAPALVQATPPKPEGYFHRSLLDYFSGSPQKQTP